MKFHDIVTDNSGKYLYQKLGHSIKPELVDSIKKQTTNLSAQGYAWPAKRLFAISTKEAAAASDVYVQAQPELPAFVKDRVKEALDIFDVEPMLVEKIAAYEPDEDYLIPERRLIRVTSADEVKTAELALHNAAPGMEVVTRTYAFRRLHEKALQYQVKLGEDSSRMVATTRCFVPALVLQLNKRAQQTSGEIKLAFRQLAKGLTEQPGDYIDNPDHQDKIAQLIHELDLKADVTRRYGRPRDLGFSDPVVSVFNTTKTASDFISLAGQQVPIDNIMGLDPERIGDVIGDEFLEDIQDADGSIDPAELAQMLSILPEDMQSEIVSRLELV